MTLLASSPSPILSHPIEHYYDAAWVRARLPFVFNFTPEQSEAEKSLLQVGFVTVSTGSAVAWPFIYADFYGRTGIMFSPDGPEQETQSEMADAFWSLLLQAPDDITDFKAGIYHPGASIWMHFGCKNGKRPATGRTTHCRPRAWPAYVAGCVFAHASGSRSLRSALGARVGISVSRSLTYSHGLT